MRDNTNNYFKEIPNYLSFFVSAAFVGSMSPILIEIGKTFIIDPKDISLIFASITIGGVAGRITSFFYRIRFKNRHIIIGAYALLSILIAILSQLKNLTLFFIIYFLSGYLLGIILVIASENLFESTVNNKERLVTIATSFAPLGSIIFPLITSALVKNGYDWKYLYYILLFLTVLMAILYLTMDRRHKQSVSASEQRLIFRGIFTNKNNNVIFILMSFCILFYVMAEFVIANWSPTFFRIKGMVDVQGAGYMLSIFWILIILGRFLVSFLAGRIKILYIMLMLTLISLVSTVFLILSRNSLTIYLFIGLAGLGYSGLYTMIFYSGSIIYRKGRGTLSTLMLLSSGIGQFIASWTTKTVSKYNVSLSMYTGVFFICTLLILIIVIIFYKKLSYSNSLT
jgi:fucose permease